MKTRIHRTAAGSVVSLAMAMGLFAGAPLRAAASEVLVTAPMAAENKRSAFRKSMRKLWVEHMVWTRACIMATIAKTPDAAAAADRLQRNQLEMGAIFVPYYGTEMGAKMSLLLKEDNLVAGEIVAARMKRDAVKVAALEKRWHDNARDIGVLLSGSNPGWPQEAFVATFDNLMTLTYRQVTARLQKKWSDDIQAFDELYVQGMDLADDIADRMIKQYPEKI